MMKSVFLLISRNRKKLIFRRLHKLVLFLYYAFENKNNDQATNGEFWLMKKLNKAGARIIFDVGANVGKWSIEADSIFDKGLIYAFEPMPEVFDTLKKNVSSRLNIKTFDFALSNEKGVLTFHYYPNAILFSSIYTHFAGGEAKQIEVQGMDGDSFCSENNITEIDFLKLDVEGSEHLVLAGFKGMLGSKKIKVIQFEYGIFSIDSKFLLKDYYSLFSGYGYRVGKIYPTYVDFGPYDWSFENFIGPNYVAIRDSEVVLTNLLR